MKTTKTKTQRVKRRPHVPTEAEKRQAMLTFFRVVRPDVAVLMRAVKRYLDGCWQERIEAGSKEWVRQHLAARENAK